MNEQTKPTPDAPPASAAEETAEQPLLVASHALPLPATFSFECHGVRFDAEIRKWENSGAQLVVLCNLGHVPFSAESATLRRYLHAVVDAGTGLPMAEITLDRRRAIVLRGTMNFPEAPSPAATAAGTAAIVISVKPLVELVATCRIGNGASKHAAG